jgi:hypothetical protein
MEDKIVNIRATDPLDLLILEKGLRIKSVFMDKESDLMILVLSNGKIIKSEISIFPRLKSGNQKQLNEYRLIGAGIGIQWEELDEDLSLKGFIKDTAIKNIIRQLQTKETDEFMLV